jgi:hypothetical protein
MTRKITISLLIALLLTTMSCVPGSGVSTSAGTANAPSSTITMGNWLLEGTSELQHGSTESAGGALVSDGSNLSMSASFSGNCFYLPGALSGTMSGSTITLTSAPEYGRTLTISGTVYNNTNINGTFKIVGGTNSNCNGDYGTIYGVLIPVIAGNYTGNLQEVPYPPPSDLTTLNTVALTLSLSQSNSPSANGSFPLSGSATLGVPPECTEAYPAGTNPPAYCLPTPPYSNSPCFSSGTIDSTQSSIQGSILNLVIDTDTGDTVNITAQLQNPNLATSMAVIGYQVNSGACAYYSANGTPVLSRS